MELKPTFTSAHDEALVGAAKSTSDDIFPTLISRYEGPDFLACVYIQHPDLSIDSVDEQMPRILTNIHRAETRLQVQFILQLARHEVVHMDRGQCAQGNQAIAVRRDCYILDSMFSAPVIDQIAVQIPLTQIAIFGETASDKSLTIRRPHTTTDWFIKAR